ncbi:DEAD/DEAH box helicase [Candidatus Gracilibacteria bacterium]|nr:DEAD/DEAH box helicase [Candidatus Gracilibacteria bacterium]
MSVEKFRKLGLSEEILKALEEKGFENPSEIQEKTIPLLLNSDKDVLGQAHTGSGKTACFALPLIQKIEANSKNIEALILAPTREISIQITKEINSFKGAKKIKIVNLYGGQSITNEMRDLKRGPSIVIGTPGRTMDHLRRGTLKIGNIKYFVLDEADEMLNMGFKEDIETILESCQQDKKMIFFSATMPKAILDIAKKFMKNLEIVKVAGKQVTNDKIQQIYYQVQRKDKFQALCRIADIHQDFHGIVFCRTKNDVDEVVVNLQAKGYFADGLHGDVKQSLREKILAKMKDKKINILVATDVAARGIDIKDLTHVVNYGIPDDGEAYTHRIGRTGRAGKTGIAITFVTPAEKRKLMNIQRTIKTNLEFGKMPEVKEILNSKKEKILEEFKNHSGIENKLFVDLAGKILEKSEDSKLVLAAILEKFYGKDFSSDRYSATNNTGGAFGGDRDFGRDGGRERGERGRGPKKLQDGMTRLFYAKGKDDGLTPKEVVDFVQKNIKIEGNKIDDIGVFGEFTFLNLPTEKAEELIDKAGFEDGRNILVKAKKREPREGGFGGDRGGQRSFRGRGGDRGGNRGFGGNRRGEKKGGGKGFGGFKKMNKRKSRD